MLGWDKKIQFCEDLSAAHISVADMLRILSENEQESATLDAVPDHLRKAMEHLQAAHEALPFTYKNLVKITPEVKPGTAPARGRIAEGSRNERNVLTPLKSSITDLNATCGILKGALEKENAPAGDPMRASVLSDARSHCLQALQAFYTFCIALGNTGNIANMQIMVEVGKYASEFKVPPKGAPKQ